MIAVNPPAVVSQEEFKVAVDAVSANEGWLIGGDGIVDPGGAIALLVSDEDADKASEAGYGLIEWLALTGVVASVVLTVFWIIAPVFIAAFQTHIINALP